MGITRDDFSTALGLANKKTDPYVARALSYLAVGDTKSAASDLDEAVQKDPLNLLAWTGRGRLPLRIVQCVQPSGL